MTQPARRTPLAARATAWLLSVAVFGLSAIAAAAESSAQRELLLFEDVTITAAAKHDQPTRQAPSAVTVVTREEIRRFGYRNLAEVLRAVRGFYITNDRNYTFLGVRGFLRPGDYSDRVLLLVNGHTYNDDIYQQAFVGNEFGIDLEAIDHVEVIRGPGSALYGGNAIFAVINVVTLTGAQHPGVEPLVETGSFGRKRGQMTAGHVTASGVDMFASGSVLDLDGQERLFYPEFDSPETHNGVARDADAEQALNFFASAHYGHFTLQGGINRREKHIPTGSFATTFNDNGSKTIDQRRFAELSYAAQPVRDVHFDARVFYDGYLYHGTYIYGAGAERSKNEDFGRSNWTGSEVRARWEAFGRNSLTVGGEYTYHPNTRQENFSLPGHEQVLDDTQTFGTWGVYLQDEFALLDTLTLVGGLRFDRYYGSVQEVSPRAAIVWTPSATTNVKLLYGRAFRPANLFEQYYAYRAGDFVYLPNSKLDPERITTYEGVLEQELWWRVRGTLAAFHYNITDLINQTEVASQDGTTTLQYVNKGEAHANGFELELRVPVTPLISLRTSYSFTDARSDDGRSLTNAPKHLGNLGVLFPLPFGVEGAAEVLLVGPRQSLARRTLETARIVNLNLNYSPPVARNLRFSVGLYNILDHTYPDPGGAEHVQDRIPQDGFSFRVQLAYGF